MQPRWHLLNQGCGVGINIFFAGSGFVYDLAYDVGVRKRLLSWHANTPEDLDEFVDVQLNTQDHSFGIVDSGAFTAWNKGDPIDCDKYAEKLVELLQAFDIAANLDVIPGKKGMAAKSITRAMTEEAAGQGWANLKKIRAVMSANGIDPARLMPIYHQGESLKWLKRMVDAGCDYIGISPSNDYHTNQRMHWLDDVFDYLTSLPTLPKTHGYAVTSEVLMKTYPWFSVDSATWVHVGAMGQVMTPFGFISMTDRNNSMDLIGGINSQSWTPEMRQKLNEYFSSIGFTVEKLRKHYEYRWQANAIYMLSLERNHTHKPKVKEESLFDVMIDSPEAGNKAEVPDGPMDCWGLTLDGGPPPGETPMAIEDHTDRRFLS